MKSKFFCRLMSVSIVFASIQAAEAAPMATLVGKITMAQGHVASNCRMVLHRETGGAARYFRIQDMGAAHDDISSSVWAALMANRDVIIYYDTAVTSGCGTEPSIQVISVF